MRVFYVWKMLVLVGYYVDNIMIQKGKKRKKKRVGKKQEDNNMYNF